MAAVQGDIAGMIAEAFLLFKGQVMFFIQNDQAQIRHRGINGRTCTEYD